MREYPSVSRGVQYARRSTLRAHPQAGSCRNRERHFSVRRVAGIGTIVGALKEYDFARYQLCPFVHFGIPTRRLRSYLVGTLKANFCQSTFYLNR